jgi:type II restriction/modification system DNA methylase subunit YeeA
VRERESGFRYTPTTCFETFPFPAASEPEREAVAEAARYLEGADETGLGTVRYPLLVPRDDEAADKLARRTLTRLYNQRPAWLDHAHRRLDEAVAAAYGWPPDLTDDEVLDRLLTLNLEQAEGGGQS